MLSEFPEPLFVVYPGSSEKGYWRAKAIRDPNEIFKNRKNFLNHGEDSGTKI